MTEILETAPAGEISASSFGAVFTGHTAIYIYILLLVLLAAAAVVIIAFTLTRGKKENDKRAASRFSKLPEIDSDMATRKAPECRTDIALNTFCDDFRNYAAGQMGLYYEPQTIRAFIAGMSVSRLLIFQGISGTGKTSLAYALGRFLQNDAVMVPVQPSWKDRTDLLGYYNEFTGNFNETELLSKLYEAEYNDEIYIALLDEMNIARVEYYFAEFLSVLELPDTRSRTVEIVADTRPGDPKKFDRGRLHISDNVWFIGTANNDDSTLAISDKVYDRATVIDLDRRAEPFKAPAVRNVKISGSYLRELFAKARQRYSMSGEMRNKISKLDVFLVEEFGITFGNRIMRQLEGFIPVYIACGGSETEAVDQMISRKILRKLEGQNPVYVRPGAEKLTAYVNELFGDGALPVCVAYLEKLAKKY